MLSPRKQDHVGRAPQETRPGQVRRADLSPAPHRRPLPQRDVCAGREAKPSDGSVLPEENTRAYRPAGQTPTARRHGERHQQQHDRTNGESAHDAGFRGSSWQVTIPAASSAARLSANRPADARAMSGVSGRTSGRSGRRDAGIRILGGSRRPGSIWSPRTTRLQPCRRGDGRQSHPLIGAYAHGRTGHIRRSPTDVPPALLCRHRRTTPDRAVSVGPDKLKIDIHRLPKTRPIEAVLPYLPDHRRSKASTATETVAGAVTAHADRRVAPRCQRPELRRSTAGQRRSARNVPPRLPRPGMRDYESGAFASRRFRRAPLRLDPCLLRARADPPPRSPACGGHRQPGASGPDASWAACLLGAFSRQARRSVTRADLDAGIQGQLRQHKHQRRPAALDHGETARPQRRQDQYLRRRVFIDWSGTGHRARQFTAPAISPPSIRRITRTASVTVIEMQTSVRKLPKPHREITPDPSVLRPRLTMLNARLSSQVAGERADDTLPVLLRALILAALSLLAAGCQACCRPMPGWSAASRRSAAWRRRSTFRSMRRSRSCGTHAPDPYVIAATDHDAAFALGMIQAHLRGGELALARHVVRGRLSELGGPRPLNDIDHALRHFSISAAPPTRRSPACRQKCAWPGLRRRRQLVRGRRTAPRLPEGPAFLPGGRALQRRRRDRHRPPGRAGREPRSIATSAALWGRRTSRAPSPASPRRDPDGMREKKSPPMRGLEALGGAVRPHRLQTPGRWRRRAAPAAGAARRRSASVAVAAGVWIPRRRGARAGAGARSA